MTGLRMYDPSPARRLEVQVYRYGMLKVCEWCASTDEARSIAETWKQQRSTRCEIVSSLK